VAAAQLVDLKHAMLIDDLASHKQAYSERCGLEFDPASDACSCLHPMQEQAHNLQHQLLGSMMGNVCCRLQHDDEFGMLASTLQFASNAPPAATWAVQTHSLYMRSMRYVKRHDHYLLMKMVTCHVKEANRSCPVLKAAAARRHTSGSF
jgi:hypothetical protein